MKKIGYTVFLGLFCSYAVKAAEIPAVSLVQQGDAAFAKRSDLPQVKIALFYYETALRAQPSNVEPYWKAAHAAWWLGDHADVRSEKLEYFQKGISYAQAALEKDPNSVESHFWLGVNEGAYGEAKGILKSLALIKPIRHEMAEVERLNDHFSGGGCYQVIAQVDYKVPGFAGGNKKRALEELNKSLAIDPNDPFIHYYFAEYFDIIGEKEKARMELKALQTLTVPPDSQPELEMMQQKGKALGEKL